MYPIYIHNWRNISTVYIYKTRLASNEIFLPPSKIHLEACRAKDFSAPRGSVTLRFVSYFQEFRNFAKFLSRLFLTSPHETALLKYEVKTDTKQLNITLNTS